MAITRSNKYLIELRKTLRNSNGSITQHAYKRTVKVFSFYFNNIISTVRNNNQATLNISIAARKFHFSAVRVLFCRANV